MGDERRVAVGQQPSPSEHQDRVPKRGNLSKDFKGSFWPTATSSFINTWAVSSCFSACPSPVNVRPCCWSPSFWRSSIIASPDVAHFNSAWPAWHQLLSWFVGRKFVGFVHLFFFFFSHFLSCLIFNCYAFRTMRTSASQLWKRESPPNCQGNPTPVDLPVEQYKAYKAMLPKDAKV